MSFDLNAVDPARAARVEPLRPAAPAPGAAGGFAQALRAQEPAVRVDTIPASPPPELRAEILTAQRVVQDLHARGRELRFEIDAGRVRIEVCDLDGNVLREIPPSRALEIAAGKAVA